MLATQSKYKKQARGDEGTSKQNETLEENTDSDDDYMEEEEESEDSDEEMDSDMEKHFFKDIKEEDDGKSKDIANSSGIKRKYDDMKGNEDRDDSKSEESSDEDEEMEEDVDSEDDNPSKDMEMKSEEEVRREVHDEYESGDSSDDEDIQNTIGNIPVNWYEDLPHLGYDWDAKKLLKSAQGDRIDDFLKKMEDPDFWRTVRDKATGQDVVITDEDINTIKRLQGNKIPDASYDEYAPWVEWFTSKVMQMPIRKFPEHKRSFVPSKDEMKIVSKYVHALKMGWMKSRRAMKRAEKRKEKTGPQFYDMWTNDSANDEIRRIENHIPAPKRPLPDHAESYNPPEEYLFTDKEMKKWNRERKSIGNKKLHFVPQKYNSLRQVPAYKRYIRERFQRCLDLYMCPRAIKMRLTIEPEDLVPQLPNPKDLQPFPTAVSLSFKGHTDFVCSVSLDPHGYFMASVSDDKTLKIWEVLTERCLKTIELEEASRSVVWCPNKTVSLLAVACGTKVLLINPKVGDLATSEKLDKVLEVPPEDDGKITPERVKTAVQWEQASPEQWEKGIRVIVNHFKPVKQVRWHGQGDYFAALIPEGENRSVIIHQLSRRKSQFPFSKARGLVQTMLFHPVKPFFFVATQRHIRIYNLVKQEMMRKLYSSSQWISSMAIHSGGDNLLVGTYDKKVLWFDLDLSIRPYKTLSLHTQAVRSVAFHKRYPLFASVSDDKSLIVSHGMVYNDLLQNATIVPLKRFSRHEMVNDFSIFDVTFHPTQPWTITSGADGVIYLYS